jgi:hypothetical protein
MTNVFILLLKCSGSMLISPYEPQLLVILHRNVRADHVKALHLT